MGGEISDATGGDYWDATDNCDAVMLAHFSTSTALDDVQPVLDRPVLSAPEAAVSRMKRLVTRG